ncbi:hypothetical protein Q9L58_010868 [Maublancomyces gigas]|uniref:DNA-directed RNA polymerase n=1 Tax=Discina gigas TaxID=1032678 RepID=A0ABR3G2X6_9PEZI
MLKCKHLSQVPMMTESIATRGDQQIPVCFVLMPIADVPGYEPGHFARTYEHLLKPAIIKAGYFPVRADDAVKTDYIVVGIIQKIVESEMVLYTEYDESLRVDTVGKDIGKIQSAIVETANATDRELNSIVRLAGIQTATIPDRQIISPDTDLLLTAIGALDRRLQEIETSQFQEAERHFSIEGDVVTFSSGLTANKGDDLFSGTGDDLGKLIGINSKRQSILVKKGGAPAREFLATGQSSKGMDTIPF